MFKIILLAGAALCLTANAAEAATPALPPILTDNAVLQRGKPIALEGTAAPGTAISIQLDKRAPLRAKADSAGKWVLTIPAQPAGSGHRLYVTIGMTQRELANIAFGDVFLCSGQSNMEFTLRHATNADASVAGANNPDLRLFNVPRQSSVRPMASLSQPTAWAVSSPASAADFSAVCYFMGAEVQQARKVPVGLIAASWGGSIIEDWLPVEALRTIGGYEPGLELLTKREQDPTAAEQILANRVTAYFDRSAASLSAAQPANTSKDWEDWGGPDFAQFDGTAVYTGKVTLTAEQARTAHRLRIGQVDDDDQTLVNGKVVGTTLGWDVQRNYELPAGTLHEGVNTVTVKVLDLGAGGGLWGGTVQAVETGAGDVPITGWQIARGLPVSAMPPAPGAPWIGGSGLATLYDGMIVPLGHIPLAGIAWYQGEANVANAKAYARLMPALIADWRSRFGKVPFVMVQLAAFGPHAKGPVQSSWAELRDVQRAVTAADPDTGLAVALDVGDPYDIHPTEKRVVGHRLALALAGKRIAALPTITRAGDEVRLAFDQPLSVIGDAAPIGFELCDGAATCRYATARMADDRTVVLGGARPQDREVRYLWADSPIANLFDQDDEPVPAFSAPLP